jgi:hypothetical protein
MSVRLPDDRRGEQCNSATFWGRKHPRPVSGPRPANGRMGDTKDPAGRSRRFAEGPVASSVCYR